MGKLFILEGADGTGKSTLAREIQESTKGHLLHGTWESDWDIPDYHEDLYEAALLLLDYQDVILDRWAVSQEVYSNAFRGGAEYSADDWMASIMGIPTMVDDDYTVFIYCENDNAVKNHKENMKVRSELFDDMGPVVREYNNYLNETKLNWIHYDFTKVNMKEFVKGIVK